MSTSQEKKLPSNRTYTVDDIAAILGIAKSTAYRLVNSGEFKTIRIGYAMIRYNKLRKLKKDKNRHGLQTSGRMKLPHTILRGVCKPCPRKLYS